MHILIISDNDSDLNWVNAPLTATGLSVNIIYAYTMKEATTLMGSVKFDLLLYDLAFSEKKMSDNFKELAGIGMKIPLIVLTEIMGDPAAKEAIQCGASYHIVKDRVKISAMAESFRSILQQQTPNYN
ncbi:response regulator [Panacibacter ginsenosidivorans]|uniref:Response regulator n=1 Tax=Panacibacter ginsenosidivorans TaxID=1813871 RepID=A0A5B8V3I2_9BACT|nr:response regulator [Panacibacter ginsenosidivorans]QEC65934.1 response regulator [Panacibacter ginsenosidivorans]